MSVTEHRISAENTTVDHLLTSLESGRVVLEFETDSHLGPLLLRQRDSKYYCDDSIRLHMYEDDEDLVAYLDELGVPSDE